MRGMMWTTTFGQVGTHCPRYGQSLRELQRMALTRLGVLLLGESGTGKELLARAVHDASERSGPFVAVNCAAIPEQLVSSVLFGHVRGAFSGATQDHPGELVASSGGTLFLDELGDAPLSVQVALLRALEMQRVKPVGGTRERTVDLRIVAATSRPLHALIARGSFRSDLYYRISGHEVRLPSLAERPVDLPDLAQELLGALGHRAGLSPSAVEELRRHPLPGNVRQLRHVLERALLRTPAGVPLGAEELAGSWPPPLLSDAALLPAVGLGAPPLSAAVPPASARRPLLDGSHLVQRLAPAVRQKAARWRATGERPSFCSRSRRQQRLEEQAWLLALLAEFPRAELPEPIARRVDRCFHVSWHLSEGGLYPKRLAQSLGVPDPSQLVASVSEMVSR